MTDRKRLVMDGLKECPQTELHSFIGSAFYANSHNYPTISITIPCQLVRQLEIKKHDRLLVAIKKATEEEINEYKEAV